MLSDNLLANAEAAGDVGSIPDLGRAPGGGSGNPLQYSCQYNPTEEPGRLQSMGSQIVRHDLATKHSAESVHN